MFLNRRIRLDFEPNLQPPPTEYLKVKTEENGKFAEEQIKMFRGTYKLNDLVRIKLPPGPERTVSTPISKPHRITEVLGNWTYRLSDGQKWYARPDAFAGTENQS